MVYKLTGEIDLTSIGDIADQALECGHNELAIRYAEEGLRQSMPLHIDRFRFYCILINAYFNQNDVE